jgi:hypothetical protein
VTPRTLPIRIPPLPGEALDSWLEWQAHQLHSPLLALFTALGMDGEQEDRRWQRRDCVLQLTGAQIENIAFATGLSTDAVTGLTLARYDGRAARVDPATGRFSCVQLRGPASGSRFCPGCLPLT